MSSWFALPFALGLQLSAESPVEILNRISPMRIIDALVVLAVLYLIIRFITAALEALSGRAVRARFFFKMLIPVIRFALWLIGTIVIVAMFDPSANTLLAVLGSVAIALGLGAQDLVKSIIGGLVILVDRPYQLGDRVKIGDAYGEINHIGLRSTKLTTPDDTRVTIPNSEILSSSAWCANSGVPDCQVVTDIFLPHDTDPTQALEIGYESAYSSPYLLPSKPVVVLLQDHFQYAPYMTLRIKAYVYDHRLEPRLQSDITLRTKTELLKRGILGRWNIQANPTMSPFQAGEELRFPERQE
jgi:MscS family membrane protein